MLADAINSRKSRVNLGSGITAIAARNTLIPLMIKFTGGRWLALFAVVMMAATSATVPSRVDGAYGAALFVILCRLAFVVLWCASGVLGVQLL